MHEIKRPSLRPVVGFSLAHDCNETVAMDLNQFRGVYVLHMVDHATRYSAVAIIKLKSEIFNDKQKCFSLSQQRIQTEKF